MARRPLEREQVYLDGGRRTTQLMRDSLDFINWALNSDYTHITWDNGKVTAEGPNGTFESNSVPVYHPKPGDIAILRANKDWWLDENDHFKLKTKFEADHVFHGPLGSVTNQDPWGPTKFFLSADHPDAILTGNPLAMDYSGRMEWGYHRWFDVTVRAYRNGWAWVTVGDEIF